MLFSVSMFLNFEKFLKEITIDYLTMKLTALVLSVWQWVAEGSPSHTSTPVKIENALQFVPKNTNPKEFKKLQQQVCLLWYSCWTELYFNPFLINVIISIVNCLLGKFFLGKSFHAIRYCPLERLEFWFIMMTDSFIERRVVFSLWNFVPFERILFFLFFYRDCWFAGSHACDSYRKRIFLWWFEFDHTSVARR